MDVTGIVAPIVQDKRTAHGGMRREGVSRRRVPKNWVKRHNVDRVITRESNQGCLVRINVGDCIDQLWFHRANCWVKFKEMDQKTVGDKQLSTIARQLKVGVRIQLEIIVVLCKFKKFCKIAILLVDFTTSIRFEYDDDDDKSCCCMMGTSTSRAVIEPLADVDDDIADAGRPLKSSICASRIHILLEVLFCRKATNDAVSFRSNSTIPAIKRRRSSS